jgi:hypothetical protein
MEELQSTEMLDREILEDARKKAARTLKGAEDTIRAQNADWEKRTSESIGELEKKYAVLREEARENIMARLPIDKRRAKVEKIENLLNSAVESWYDSLSRERIIEMMTGELVKRLALCEEFSNSSKKRAFFSGLGKEEAKTVLKNAGVDLNIEEIQAVHRFPSIILESERVKIIVSILKMVDFLLQEKRAELVEALVGRDFMEEK